MRVKDVPVECKRKVLSFYTHYYQEKSVFDEAEIIEKLPEYLQTNLIHIIYGSLIENVPIFKVRFFPLFSCDFQEKMQKLPPFSCI